MTAPGRSPIKVVLIDDHAMVLDSLARIIDQQLDMTAVATAATVAEGLLAVAAHVPDIVLIDYELPDGDGATAAARMTAHWPDMRVIMLTGSTDEAAVFAAARGGCSGYLGKTSAADELVRMVRSVHGGAVEMPAERLSRLPRLEELVVHYQPIVDLDSAAIVGFEALVRWAHPTRGLVEPAKFISLAEHTSFIVEIDEHVRRVACLQAADWNRRFVTTPARFMSVNLSGRELRQADLPARIAETLADTGLDPTELMIEVTETFLVGESQECASRLTQLKDLGIRIALDDFGTAFSSLKYLRRFPIDVIKLDKSFTDDLPHGARGLKLIDAVGQLAVGMDALAEAEGIETEEQAECLRSLGWKLGQGYHFSRPADAEAVEALL